MLERLLKTVSAKPPCDSVTYGQLAELLKITIKCNNEDEARHYNVMGGKGVLEPFN